MRPVMMKKKHNYVLWGVYATIVVACIAGIVIALSNTKYFKEENVGRALGIVDKDSEKEDEYNELKTEFETLFTNQLEKIQSENISVQKLRDNYDIVVTAFTYKKNEGMFNIDANIPYINISNDAVKPFNQLLVQKYRKTAETLMNQISSMNIIYSVDYKAYLQNNILSVVVRSKYKEGNNEQKVEIQTINYNLIENREVTIEDILNLKNIKKEDATNKIKNEIKEIQEQNQPLIDELGYNFYKRDYTNDRYNILNSKQFLYGKNGMLYIIYAYGNEENTSEMDIVIFE